MVTRAIVLSDLHLAVGKGYGFVEDAALERFLKDLAAGPPTELILAGDVFDFLLDPAYTAFDPDQAVARFEAILAAHPRVLSGLRAFAAVPEHELTVLAGNHDPELLLPAVRERFGFLLDRTDLRFDAPLVPAGEGPAVFGRAIGPDDAPIWVVHGDRWDLENHVDRASLLDGRPFALPIGSELVIHVVRPLLESGYPWVYEIKPELDAVMPLVLYLDPALAGGFLQQNLGLSARLLTGQVRGAVGATDLFGEDEAEPLPEWTRGLAQALGEEDPADQEALLAELQDALRHGHPERGEGTLAGHGGLRRWLLRAWIGRSRAAQVDGPDAPDPTPDRAAPKIPPKVRGLIAGHTHAPRWWPTHGPAYLNTGTWLPTMLLPEGDIPALIDAVERGEIRGTAPRTFVEVDLTGPPTARLRACDPEGVVLP